MDTKKLRQKLLDLAIHGKLVPQDPNDEPASELLARIHEEKLAMVERSELKPKDVKNDTVIYFGSDGLPYEKPADGKGEAKRIEGEIPFEIPEGWSWARLGQLVATCGGKTPSKANEAFWEGGGVPWITSKDMKEPELFGSQIELTESGAAETNMVPAGSVLMVVRSGILRRLLPVAINRVETTINQDLKAMTPYDLGLSGWLLTCFNAWDKRIRNTYHKDGTTVDSIEFDAMLSMLIPIPPLAEQRRIVEALDKYLALVDGIERDRADLDGLLAQLKSKVLDLAVRGELVEHDPGDEPASELLARVRGEKLAMVGRGELKPKDIKGDTVIFAGSDGLRYEKPADGKGEAKCIEGEIPFEIPEGWSWARLKTLCLPQEKRLPSGERFNYIDIGSIDNSKNTICANEINTVDAPSRASRCVHDGSVVFSMVRPYLRNIAQVPASMKNSVASTGFYIATRASDDLDDHFMFQLMLSDYAVNSINAHMKGDNSPSVRKEDMDALLLPVPPLAEQRRIVKRIEEAFDLLD